MPTDLIPVPRDVLAALVQVVERPPLLRRERAAAITAAATARRMLDAPAVEPDDGRGHLAGCPAKRDAGDCTCGFSEYVAAKLAGELDAPAECPTCRQPDPTTCSCPSPAPPLDPAPLLALVEEWRDGALDIAGLGADGRAQAAQVELCASSLAAALRGAGPMADINDRVVACRNIGRGASAALPESREDQDRCTSTRRSGSPTRR